jgi:type II secretory pathway pseudopilin PulG
MTRPHHRSQGGFTYLMLLWWVAIGGVMLAALGQQWGMASRRERDDELKFRGEQIGSALSAYAKVPIKPGQHQLPLQLSDLLDDKRTGVSVHHLRRLWPDPVTGRPEWGLIRQQPGGEITGVYSLSKQKPVRAPAGVSRYEDWHFEMNAP